MNYAASTARPGGPSLLSAGGGGDDNARSAADDFLLFPRGFYFTYNRQGDGIEIMKKKIACR